METGGHSRQCIQGFNCYYKGMFKKQLSLPFGGLTLHLLIDSMDAMNRDFDM